MDPQGSDRVLKGNLADFPLVGVLQMLRNAARSGTVRITHERGGVVGVEAGRIVHAAVPPTGGERALSILASLEAAPFVFEAAVPPERSITRPSDLLLADLAQDTLAWANVRSRLGNWSAVPRWSGAQPPVGDTEALQVARLVNGQRSIETIIHGAIGLSPRRAAEILVDLIDSRLASLRAPPAVEPVELVALSVYTPDERTIFVDRAVHAAWAALFGEVYASLVTPKGWRANFRVQPRDHIAGRVLVADAALRKLRIGRGVKVTLQPGRED